MRHRCEQHKETAAGGAAAAAIAPPLPLHPSHPLHQLAMRVGPAPARHIDGNATAAGDCWLLRNCCLLSRGSERNRDRSNLNL